MRKACNDNFFPVGTRLSYFEVASTDARPSIAIKFSILSALGHHQD